jgi:hypothetical protein
VTVGPIVRTMGPAMAKVQGWISIHRLIGTGPVLAKSKVYEFEIATARPDDQVDFELAKQMLRARWEADGRIVTGEKIDPNDPTLVNVANVDEVPGRSRPT